MDILKRNHILIVEDNLSMANMLAQLIEHHAIRASQSQSGNDALVKIEHEPPDLILLDLGLRDMNGLELATDVRRNEKTKSIPILVISGTPEQEDDCLKRGCNGFLLKPFALSELLTRIKCFL
jgi:DNA-binding response OmpR family regulator